eukprot:TRINITY_DN7738_c0_g1_i1.p1 TRINITY_DN7738_c0_g1~~TRINITY_DN7738_c0_g1_i1.p1  ORF type:complete len:207 (-),score=48.91 TRINITY_DN7738_c0_g1_i1:316-936(-)
MAIPAESARTPQEVFADLQRGHMRFRDGTCKANGLSAAIEQPSVAVFGCSDWLKPSQLPLDRIFDVEPCEIFDARRNCLDRTRLADLRFAANRLKVKALVVMGHTGCPACKAAGLPDSKEAVTANLKKQLAQIAGEDSLMKRVEEGDLRVVAGYESARGVVDFLPELELAKRSAVPAMEGAKIVQKPGVITATNSSVPATSKKFGA